MNQTIFVLLLQQKLSFIRVYTQMIWRAFWRTSRNFPAFKTSLGLLYSTLQHFCSACLFDVLKWSSTLLIDSPNSGFTVILNLVCYMVVNTWNQKYAGSDFLEFVRSCIALCIALNSDYWRHNEQEICSINEASATSNKHCAFTIHTIVSFLLIS